MIAHNEHTPIGCIGYLAGHLHFQVKEVQHPLTEVGASFREIRPQ
jgi:hypothetical protein